ncbi:hypothetical protein AB4Z22_38215, partial [Paenibacillus sp. TAF58]
MIVTSIAFVGSLLSAEGEALVLVEAKALEVGVLSVELQADKANILTRTTVDNKLTLACIFFIVVLPPNFIKTLLIRENITIQTYWYPSPLSMSRDYFKPAE